jgi:hypothetical protein
LTKEVECEENDPDGEARWVSVVVQVEGTEMEIDKDELRYFKTIKVNRKWNRWKCLRGLWTRYERTIERGEKLKAEVPKPPKLADFNAAEWQISDDLIVLLRDPVACEAEYYGFEWVHDLEKSPDFKGGMTFDRVRTDNVTSPVEMKIKAVRKCESKKKEGFFYWQIECEDVTGEQGKMNIWPDDWERWEPEFKKGNLLRVRVSPPSGGFPTYTFDSPPKQHRWKLVPKNKDDDFRVVVMRQAVRQIDKCLTDDEAMELMAKGIQKDDDK